MKQPQEIELQLPYLRLSALRWGDTGGERVLAVHGWLDNAASFGALAPLVDDVDLVAIDLPGHGRSDHRAAGAYYHFIDYLGDVLRAADALGWDQFVLLGHSLGAAISSVLAAAVPERVRQLWLIEGLGPLATPGEKALALLRQALTDRQAISAKSLRVFAQMDDAVAARRQVSGLDESAAAALVERGSKPAEGGWVWSSDPRLTLTSAIRLTEEQILAYLRGIACPSLLVLADPSPPYWDEKTMRERCAALPQLVVRRIPGSHHLHLVDSLPVAREIGAFRRANAVRTMPKDSPR